MDKTDRELLEAAAKAAGIELRYWSESQESFNLALMEPRRWWNPLADDGDALRLAVRLRIDLSLWININAVTAKTHIGAGRGIPLHGEYKRPQNDHAEPYNDDPYAATRRAIVRAAAAMGENNGNLA